MFVGPAVFIGRSATDVTPNLPTMGKADSINVSKEAAGKFVTGGTPAASTVWQA